MAASTESTVKQEAVQTIVCEVDLQICLHPVLFPSWAWSKREHSCSRNIADLVSWTVEGMVHLQLASYGFVIALSCRIESKFGLGVWARKLFCFKRSIFKQNYFNRQGHNKIHARWTPMCQHDVLFPQNCTITSIGTSHSQKPKVWN